MYVSVKSAIPKQKVEEPYG